MVQVNLLPDVVLNRRRDARLRQLATTALVVWVIALVGVTALALVYRAYQDGQLKNAQAKYSDLNSTVNSPDNVAFRKEALEVQSSLDNLRNLIANQGKLTVISNKLAAIMPRGVSIKDIALAADGKVNISIVASSYTEGAKLVSAMKNTKKTDDNKNPVGVSPDGSYFDGVNMLGANRSDSSTVRVSIQAQFFKSGNAQ